MGHMVDNALGIVIFWEGRYRFLISTSFFLLMFMDSVIKFIVFVKIENMNSYKLLITKCLILLPTYLPTDNPRVDRNYQKAQFTLTYIVFFFFWGGGKETFDLLLQLQ